MSNVPQAVDASTADTALYLLLGALREFHAPTVALREGKWRGEPEPPLGHDPEGKVLGILGMGGIGKNLKAKAEALGMRVLYHNRREVDGEEGYRGFEELLREVDVLSLNLPLNVRNFSILSVLFLFLFSFFLLHLFNSRCICLIRQLQPSTHHIISTPQFNMMKDSIIIINTARGGVIDEAALVYALDSGKVRSVGLDVYEDEPKVHPGLLENPRVTLLPHMGTWTVEVRLLPPPTSSSFSLDPVRAAFGSWAG